MSTIGMPSLAMLLVLTNLALCLSVDRRTVTSDLGRPTALAFTPTPLDAPHNHKASHRPDGEAATVTVPFRAD